ncbi:FAD dependent oxidoreductase [Colletotrichum asianum]
MDEDSKVVIIGAGVFGLSTAVQLAIEGFKNVVVVDRHMPPVPDGSSCDISRVIRFDHADEDYLNVSYEAYLKWSKDPKFKDIFHPSSYILTGSMTGGDESWIDRTTRQLSNKGLAWTKLDDAAAAKRAFPILSGKLAEPGFIGYYNDAAGWADATKAIIQLRDECLELGISFISGPAGTVVIAYTPLSDTEVQRYEKLPIYANFNTGWFNFPPHADTKTLKMAVHGWGYTRTPSKGEALIEANISTPRVYPSRERPNFCPSEGEERLRNGLREILPELADRPLEKVTMCWYTDTPSGDFIMDYHPDYQNLFVGGAGSGHAFKFLPVLGEYMSLGLKRTLPANLSSKWRFRMEYKDRPDVFEGDGSRGGPARRELSLEERARLDSVVKSHL